MDRADPAPVQHVGGGVAVAAERLALRVLVEDLDLARELQRQMGVADPQLRLVTAGDPHLRAAEGKQERDHEGQRDDVRQPRPHSRVAEIDLGGQEDRAQQRQRPAPPRDIQPFRVPHLAGDGRLRRFSHG